MILYQSNQPTIITKVKAHANIDGNERADKLAKDGTKLAHSLPTQPYKNAHSTPYHLHKDN
jgi:ribonuclease HI